MNDVDMVDGRCDICGTRRAVRRLGIWDVCREQACALAIKRMLRDEMCRARSEDYRDASRIYKRFCVEAGL